MENYFQIDCNSSVLIYGGASIGIIAHNICMEKNISVKGFIDKRGDEISQLCGLKVWSLSDEDINGLDKNSIIFVGVKNVFEHDNIAKKLVDCGFNNIIYRPYSVIKGGGTKEEKLLYDAYDKFMSKEIDMPWKMIPKTFKIHSYDFKDCSVIKTEDQYKTVYIPIECLYTDNKEVKDHWAWANIPVIALIPHIDFFKYMDGQSKFSYQRYIDFCVGSAKAVGQIEITERWKENVIKNRADVYANMSLALERDFDFFVRNAPAGEWNPEGYFNLVSGKHRAAFFVAKGRQYFPLKISEDDYNRWINRIALDKFTNKFYELGLQESHSSIEHPYFYDMKCDNRIFYYKLLSLFVYHIALQQYDREYYINLNQQGSVVISLNDDGYIARNLQRYGIGVKVYNKSILGEMLDELLLVNEQKAKNLEYAIIEYKFGTEICFEELIGKDFKQMIAIVRTKDLGEFEKESLGKLSVLKSYDGYKDGESVKVYWLGY